MFITQ